MIISQYGMAGGHPQRSHPQMLTDQSMYPFLFLRYFIKLSLLNE
jgi:hypothetical protein